MKWADYREKLGIGFSDSEKGKRVACGLLSALDRANRAYSDDELINFLMMTGEESEYPDIDNFKQVYYILEEKKEEFPVFLSCYIALINCESSDKGKEFYRNMLLRQLDQFKIIYAIVNDQDGVFVLPKGVEELDDALVSASLEWLNEYPDARKLFVKALRMYSEATEDMASDVVDAFRKALECFFQVFFNSNKSLENLKAEYGKYLSEHGAAKEISNNFTSLLQQYTDYVNNYAKHHSQVKMCVLEYWMYQTLNIVRLLITLKKEEQ